MSAECVVDRPALRKERFALLDCRWFLINH
jgi:hypothetical protein